MTLSVLASLLASGEETSVSLTEKALKKAEKDEYHSFTALSPYALKDAEESDRRRKEGTLLSFLDGIPFAVKDNLLTEGIPTEAGSAILEGYVPPFDADAVGRLRAAGGILIGKTNLDQFGMGNATDTSVFGRTVNPHLPDRSCGGSSGGSAAAVAAEIVPFALGSDTGGSSRLPAAFCGTCGLRPTYGSVSRYGLIAYASSLDTVGILSETPRDALAVFGLISGKSEHDSTSREFKADLPTDKKIAVFTLPEDDGRVRELLLQGTERLRAHGYSVTFLPYPWNPKEVLSVYRAVAYPEAFSNLGRYDGIRYGRTEEAESIEELFRINRQHGFGETVKERLAFAQDLLKEENRGGKYRSLLAKRKEISETLSDLLASYDAILSPVCPVPAPKVGIDADLDAYLMPASLAGLPALAIPFEDGIGLQFTGIAGGEEFLCTLGAILQEGDEAK